MHSYQHNIKTFNSATRHLTRVERSLYRDLIELYYDTEKPLTNCLERLARLVIAHSDEEKNALKYVLTEFFELTGDVYTHSFCDDEIDKFRSNNSAKAKAGRASAEARKKKAAERKRQRRQEKEQDPAHVESVLNEGEASVKNQEPRTINQQPTTNNQEEDTASAKADIATQIFEYWKEVMGKGSNATFSKKRRAKVNARLKDGYSDEFIRRAIYGCSITPHNNGTDPKGTGQRYDDLELICRSPENLERFAGNADGNKPARQMSEATERTVRNIIDLELD